MPKDGSTTRKKILDVSQRLFLDRSFSGTSIDHVLHESGITKGAFFYHFKSKEELAFAVVERYAQMDREHFEKYLQRAEGLSRDPLQQFLILVGFFIEEMRCLDEPYPGCLYASYCYQAGVLQGEVMNVVVDSMRFWREKITEKLEDIVKNYSPRMEVNLESLADMVLSTFEGAWGCRS